MYSEFSGWNKPGCSQSLPCRDQALVFSRCTELLSQKMPRDTRAKVVSECNARALELHDCLSTEPPYVQDILGRSIDMYAASLPSIAKKRGE